MCPCAQDSARGRRVGGQDNHKYKGIGCPLSRARQHAFDEISVPARVDGQYGRAFVDAS